MTNDERNPKPEGRKTLSGAFADFVLRILSFLRISSLVIRICEEWFMESPLGRAAVHRDHEPAGQTLGAPASRRRGRRRSQARFRESLHVVCSTQFSSSPTDWLVREIFCGRPTNAPPLCK